LVDHLFRLVTNFSNDCSKFQQIAKRLGTDHQWLPARSRILAMG